MAQLHNEYSLMLGIFEKIPKTVLAALVVSGFYNRLNIEPDAMDKALLDEWETLYSQNIVLQKPPKLP